jgi:hypothetical protein
MRVFKWGNQMNKAITILVLLTLLCSTVSAQLIYRGDFGPLKAPPLFTVANGAYQLPDEPAANQLQWILDQLALSDTSLADINAHFSPSWLGSIDAQQTRDFIDAVRTDYPDAIITDLVALTAMHAFAFIEGQDASANTGTILIEVSYTGSQLITAFGVNAHNGNLQYPEDMNLDLNQAINKFTTLAADTGLLIAWINDNDECQTIAAHQPDTLRATGSLFKPWVLGGLADEIDAGNLSATDDVEFVASERVFNDTLVNREPFGTMFKLGDLAGMMLGNSDNTATDLVHETVGRGLIDAYIDGSGVNDATVLKPILSVNEQFHLFFSFPLVTAQNYVSDTEANQLDFINNQIVPLGPVSSFPFNNESLLTSGSWRATPRDVCANMARLRQYDIGSSAMQLVDRAYGAQAAQFGVRPLWDRVWYKGGSLVSGSTGYHVLTHAWLLEDNGRWPVAVVAMANDAGGGIDDDSGIFKVQSVLSRILELTAEGL